MSNDLSKYSNQELIDMVEYQNSRISELERQVDFWKDRAWNCELESGRSYYSLKDEYEIIEIDGID